MTKQKTCPHGVNQKHCKACQMRARGVELFIRTMADAGLASAISFLSDLMNNRVTSQAEFTNRLELIAQEAAERGIV